MHFTCRTEQVPLCICNVHLVTESLTSGLLQVAHKIHTLRVELYENAADYVRLTLEVLLTLGIGYTVYVEFKAIFMTHMKTVSLLGAANFPCVSPAGCYRQCCCTAQAENVILSCLL